MQDFEDIDAARRAGRGPICRHLGTEDDRSAYLREPSARHRCYLWWQRDRIDLAHQARFCLTDAHSECPWLSVSPPTSIEREGRILPLRPEAPRVSSPSPGRAVAILIAVWAWVRMVATIFVHWIATLVVASGRWLLPATARLARFVWARLKRTAVGVLRGASARLLRRRAGVYPQPRNPMPYRGAGEQPLPSNADAEVADAPVAADAPRTGGAAMAPGDQSAPTPVQAAERPLAAAPASVAHSRESPSLVRRLVKPPVTAWRCSACEAINAGPSQVCTKCGRPSPEVEEQLTASGDELLTKGLAGLKAKNEDLAHAYFVLASEATPESELAWYWRAKTAPALDEVVRCLECIVALNPENTKAQAELESARQRLQPRQAEPVPVAAPRQPPRPARRPKIVGEVRWWLLQAAGLCAFALSLALLVPYGLSLTDLPSSPRFKDYLAFLPSVELPKLLVHLPNLPAFDIGPVLPLLLGLLLLHAAFVVVSGGGLGVRIWTALLGAGTAALVMSFGTAATGTGLAIDLAVVAVAMALAGDAQTGTARHGEAAERRPVL